ncbi:hypothetical protein AB1N83_013338 [Pleurotus pulmonarius]
MLERALQQPCAHRAPPQKSQISPLIPSQPLAGLLLIQPLLGFLSADGVRTALSCRIYPLLRVPTYRIEHRRASSGTSHRRGPTFSVDAFPHPWFTGISSHSNVGRMSDCYLPGSTLPSTESSSPLPLPRPPLRAALMI